MATPVSRSFGPRNTSALSAAGASARPASGVVAEITGGARSGRDTKCRAGALVTADEVGVGVTAVGCWTAGAQPVSATVARPATNQPARGVIEGRIEAPSHGVLDPACADAVGSLCPRHGVPEHRHKSRTSHSVGTHGHIVDTAPSLDA